MKGAEKNLISELKDPLFSLKPSELKVVKLLTKGKKYSLTELSDLTNLPRTSLYPIIKRLKQRNLVKREPKRGGKVFLREESTNRVNTKKEPRDILFHFGIQKLIRLYEKLGDIAVKDRFHVIETPDSINAMTKKIPNNKIIELNKLYGQKKLIADAILPESFLQQKIDLLKERGDSVSEYFKAMHKRMYAIYTVPDNFLSFNAEVIIVKNVIFLVNWENDVAYEIKDREITNMLKVMYESLKMVGKKIDFNKYIEKVI